jgi:protein-disulfide isomerase
MRRAQHTGISWQYLGVLGLAMIVCLAAGKGWGSSPQEPGEDRVMAEVDGEFITAEAVEEALGYRLYQLKQQLYRLQRQKLDELIAEKLLQRAAAGQGISVQQLLEAEVMAKVQVTDQEVKAFYQEHKDSLQAPEAVAWEAIKRHLEHTKQAELKSQLVEGLRARAQVRDYLQAPARLQVDYLVVPGAPFKGPKNAPITIVEFSDFQCPFCAKAQAILREVLDAYPTQVRLVYRHFPLERHPEAKLAAEAAECAAQQGKFWEYHDQVWANASQLNRDQLRAIAEEIRLDVQVFATCLEAGKPQTRLAEDVADGREAGVRGTPTFFINGRMVEGAPPFATFKRIIDQQLALRQRFEKVMQRPLDY